ncbi:MAG: ZIP family metal transporter [Pseudomonadota bacterium]
MNLLAWIMLFSLIGGVLSVLAAGAFLLFPERSRIRLLPHLVSFAVGALLGAAFLELLPEAMESPHVTTQQVGAAVLIGLLIFFVLEKIVLWRHSHADSPECAATPGHAHHHPPLRAAGILIVIGDAIHNFVDGILIAAAFLTDVRLGIITSLAVAAHEIPQEVGDFAILLHSGYSRAKALFYNILSSVTTIIGALLAYYSLAGLEQVVPFVLAIAAASFIYIAVADLLPDLHQRAQRRASLQQFALIGLGIALIYAAEVVLH